MIPKNNLHLLTYGKLISLFFTLVTTLFADVTIC